MTFIDADAATTYRLGLEFDGFALSLNGMPLVSGVNGESAFARLAEVVRVAVSARSAR